MVNAFEELLAKADEALRRNEWLTAEELFSKAYKVGPQGDANVYAGMGFAAYKLGKFMLAARFFADACLRRSETHWMMFLTDSLRQLGSPLAAFRLGQYILSSFPERAKALIENGVLIYVQQDLHAYVSRIGIEWKRDAVEDTSPAAATATSNLAKMLNSNKPHEAVKMGKSLLRSHPRSTGIHINLGIALKRCGSIQEAIVQIIKAYLLNSAAPGVCANLGNVLIEQGEIFQAIHLLEVSAIIDDSDPLIWSNLASAYNNNGSMPIEAEFAARRALGQSLRLNRVALANTYRSLAASLSRQGRVKEALVEYQKGQIPEDEVSLTAPLLAMIMDDQLDADSVSKAHVKYAKSIECKIISRKIQRSKSFPDNLKIGFVTADFRDHSVAYFALPLVENLKRYNVQLYSYFNFGQEDNITDFFKMHFHKWRNVKGLPDDKLVSLIRSDNVDVLFDLSGHTSGHRMPVFIRRAAPLQMTWLGHPATTGLSTMDARITDHYADPVGVDHRYTEKLIRLDGSFCAYRPLIRQPHLVCSDTYSVKSPPVTRNNYITFGSCNTLSKYSDSTVDLWAQVLKRVPGSKLLIESPGLHTITLQRSLTQRFMSFGIPDERLLLRGRDRGLQYLIYNDIDISLDSFPCNGGTTTLDLLWMGVPLVTRAGDSFAARMGASFLTVLGRSQWVASSDDDFVRVACDLASDAARLSRWRAQQRGQMEASALMDELGFAKRFLSGVKQAWSLGQ